MKPFSLGRRPNLLLILTVGCVLFQTPTANAVDYVGRSFKDPFNTLENSITAVPPNAVSAVPAPPQENLRAALTLEGIVWDSSHPQAIINGKVLERGSRIGLMEIVGIEKEGVRIREDQEEFTLHQKGRG